MSENVIEVEGRWDCPFLWIYDCSRKCHANPVGPAKCGEWFAEDAIPPDCPLRKGPVIVRMKEAEHE